MSTLVAPRETDPDLKVTQGRVIGSEWIKFTTLRSSWLITAAAFVGLIVLGGLIGYNTGKSSTGLAPEDSAASGPLQGYYLAQLLMGVLGVLFVTGEYGTGMSRATFAAVPRRLPVLLAKSLVFGTFALVTMVPAVFVAFFVSQGFLRHYGHGHSLGDPHVLRSVIGTGVYLALIGLLGGAIGWIVRNTPAGITSFVGLMLVLPVLLMVLPGNFSENVSKYLPSEAGASFVMSVNLPMTLSPWTGLVVLVAWVVAALVLAGVLLERRDV